MSDNKYNGWTNYATWRVKMELFDTISFVEEDFFGGIPAEALEDMVENWVFENHTGSLGLVEDYARAFLANVNYHEIAKSIKEDISHENEAREFLNTKENE